MLPMRRDRTTKERLSPAANLIMWLIVACLVLAFPLSGCSGQSKDDASISSSSPSASSTSAPDPDEARAAGIPSDSAALQEDEGVTPSVKAALDEYETFMNQYCDFMEKYIESGYSTSMLTDYSKFMSQYNKVTSRFRAIDTAAFTPADSAYYAEVVARTTERLSEIL